MTEDRRRVAVTAAGMAVEGYDWVTFLALLPYMTRAVVSDDASGLTIGFAIFAAGFLSRPIGAFALGRIADIHGRTYAFTMSLWIGVTATLGMAVTPAVDALPWLAPLLLLISRVVLGAAHGGQSAVVNARMYEMRDVGLRLDPSALVYTMAATGKVISLALTLTIVNSLDRDAMTGWGWRIPYVVGAVAGAALALVAARTGDDGPRRRRVDPAVRLSRTAIAVRMLAVVSVTVGTTLTYNIWIASTVPYAVAHLGAGEAMMLATSLAQTLAFAGLVVAVGMMMQRQSRTRLHTMFAFANSAICVPVLLLTGPSTTVAAYLVGTTLATIVLAGLCATLPAVISALFPRAVRGVGNGLPYAVAVALVGGTAPGLRETLSVDYRLFVAYVVAACTITTAAAVMIGRRADTAHPASVESSLAPTR